VARNANHRTRKHVGRTCGRDYGDRRADQYRAALLVPRRQLARPLVLPGASFAGLEDQARLAASRSYIDGAIANVYDKGKIVWQGKDTDTGLRVKGLWAQLSQ